MALSEYHLKQANYSDEEIQKRADGKEQELVAIFQQVKLGTDSKVVQLAVLGCADKRYVRHHKRIFENVLGKPVEVTTFDVTVEHLAGEEGVIEHDCTKPLPNPPYDITYGHVLLKFIGTEKQWDLLKNSYEALKHGGVAIHILDKEDYETTASRLPDGYYSVPLKRWKEKLETENIKFEEIAIKYGLVLVLTKLRICGILKDILVP